VLDWPQEVHAMATYEFECQACGRRFELSMPMTEHDHLKQKAPACPGCGKRKTRQLVSMFNCPPPKATF
jgi:putative FmdB family regulatory protein